jgi:hypothetical protein
MGVVIVARVSVVQMGVPVELSKCAMEEVQRSWDGGLYPLSAPEFGRGSR